MNSQIKRVLARKKRERALFFTVALSLVLAPNLTFASPLKIMADKIVIEKKRHQLTLYQNRKKLRTYKIALGSGGLSPKKVEGDRKTPEGIYKIDTRNPKSQFHRALHISYPNDKDRTWALTRGRTPGGNIMIHGQRNDGTKHQLRDWTAGCIAVTDKDIDEIWNLVPDGTTVEIKP